MWQHNATSVPERLLRGIKKHLQQHLAAECWLLHNLHGWL
jgi:hypothetical protein